MEPFGSKPQRVNHANNVRSCLKALAFKRVIALRMHEILDQKAAGKALMTKRIKTSRTSVNRLLDANNLSLTFDALHTAAGFPCGDRRGWFRGKGRAEFTPKFSVLRKDEACLFPPLCSAEHSAYSYLRHQGHSSIFLVMASAAQLKALLQSHADGDDSRFYAIGLQVAAAEARKGHVDLAKELRDIVEKKQVRDSQRAARVNLLHIAEPQGEVAELLSSRQPAARLSDLILDDAASTHIRRVLHEQMHLEKLKSHGLRPRQTLLLTGPPGCGKTLTASTIAGELGLPLFIVRLESLMTRYLGETASKLRLIFDAVERTRAVYLFDEFDSIGIARGSENDVGEMRRVLNAFLVFVESHRGNSIIIAATNHGHLLDRALYRRFDDLIELGLPNLELAERTFRERLAGQKNQTLAYAKLALAAERLSFAEITRVCEESIKDMLLNDKKTLSTQDVLKVISERRIFLDRRVSP